MNGLDTTQHKLRFRTTPKADYAQGVFTVVALILLTSFLSATNAQAQQPPSPLPHDLSPWGMFISADIVVQSVMVGLFVASIVTWTVGLAKGLELLIASRRLRRSLANLQDAPSLAEATLKSGRRGGMLQAMLHIAMTEIKLSHDAMTRSGVKERVASHLSRVETSAGRSIVRGTGVLATIGATAPFVGLFGTVWGIMNSFIGISKAQTTNLAVVAPGIAEALLATALGLVAAIPAVIIYNQFARWTAAYRSLVGDAAALVQRLVSRDLDRAGQTRSSKAAE